MNEKFDYKADALEKLAKYGGSITIRLSNTKDAPWHTGGGRNPHYRVTLKGPGGSYTFDFWDSIVAGMTGEKVSVYSVLACLQWYDVGSLNDFCADYGYADDIKGERAWKACCQQYESLCRVFPEESARELLSTIR